MNKQSLQEFKANVCTNTFCQVRLQPLVTLQMLIQCPNFHDDSDKRRNAKDYKAIYLYDCANEKHDFCNNIIEYLYHPLIYGTLPCIYSAPLCSVKNCPFSHQERLVKEFSVQYRFIQKLEQLVEAKSKEYDQLQVSQSHFQYIYGREVGLYEDAHHEFKHFKSLRMDLIVNYICAFLNSDGGSLYIGISDQGIIKGIKLSRSEIDAFQLDLDQILRHFDPMVLPQQIQLHLHQVHYDNYTAAQFIYVMEIKVCVLSGEQQLYFTHQNETYIKRNASINMLKPKEIKDYLMLKLSQK